jgi:hypothetical protein
MARTLLVVVLATIILSGFSRLSYRGFAITSVYNIITQVIEFVKRNFLFFENFYQKNLPFSKRFIGHNLVFIMGDFLFYVNRFPTNSAKIAHNVPAVYDVLAARISKCAAFAGRTKCGGGLPWE